MTQRDKQMFMQICDEQRPKPMAIWNATAFLLNIIMKGIPIGVYFFSSVLYVIFSRTLVNQLIVIFVVVEFWFTKNVTGRRLIGIRWYFGEDDYGRQKLMYECRANDEYISFVAAKLFWILQLVYILLPGVMIATTFVISPVLYQVDFGRVSILLVIFVGGASNLFFFFRATLGTFGLIQPLRRSNFFQDKGLESTFSRDSVTPRFTPTYENPQYRTCIQEFYIH